MGDMGMESERKRYRGKSIMNDFSLKFSYRFETRNLVIKYLLIHLILMSNFRAFLFHHFVVSLRFLIQVLFLRVKTFSFYLTNFCLKKCSHDLV